MDPKQKKKWEEKIAKAKAEDKKNASAKSGGKANLDPVATRKKNKKTTSPRYGGNKEKPDLNAIRKRYVADKTHSTAKNLPLEPDPNLEDDIEVEVKPTKQRGGSDADNNLTSKKIVIKSKSKGTLGFNG